MVVPFGQIICWSELKNWKGFHPLALCLELVVSAVFKYEMQGKAVNLGGGQRHKAASAQLAQVHIPGV